ncbi:MBL fold metallo-hydrolase [Mucilaginibacter achroorhodeus]|uniref:MBL fold metallo-hydrolase n=1 Tax=Mucilaginibacter achroorhodeus TaxID=2599294 RepID=A0A563U9V4_9SPHI|nr:MBL fold metallo-hydrolase [Mucilaginibacter achroorhodeus]TWR28096.1 MBL fold metallo-hydrolase [Mucilaginibacter achroorhodeus]
MSLARSRKEGAKYQNTISTTEGGFNIMFPMMREYINNKAETVPKKTLGPFKTDMSIYQTPPSEGLRITWIGHSSLIIEIDGIRILTDPVWSQRVSFTQLMGPKRFFQPPLALANLPPIDLVICSHDHYDHLDEATIRFLADKNIPFITSLGVGKYLTAWGVKPELVKEMDWGDTFNIKDLSITSCPTRHFSGRGITHRNETLWASFVIKGPKHNIYFGADSGWSPDFEKIGEAYGPFDLTILEIGAYGKYWPDIHMGPNNASNAHLALKGKVMMPIHWATFNLALHAWYEPAELLEKFAEQKNIELFLPEPGQPTEVSTFNSKWWKRFMSNNG